MNWDAIEVEAEIAPGEALYVTAEEVRISPEYVDEHEIIYKARESFAFCDAGDYLICEPRNHAATGELVLAHYGPRIHLGRFWGKNGLHELRDPHQKPIPGTPSVFAVVTLIVRLP